MSIYFIMLLYWCFILINKFNDYIEEEIDEYDVVNEQDYKEFIQFIIDSFFDWFID